MLHACIRRFDVTGTVEIFLGTKHPLITKDKLYFCNLHLTMVCVLSSRSALLLQLMSDCDMCCYSELAANQHKQA